MKFLLLFLVSSSLLAQDDPFITQQKADCAANTAKEWSPELDRCVNKAEAVAIRNQAKECNKIENLDQRKACHMKLASTDTGVTSDAGQALGKMSDLQSRSTLINGANSIVAAINFFAKDESKNSCMSKSIFGVTALGGFLSDLYLKRQTKNKLEALQKQYQIGANTTAYDSQYKALEYLRDEQKTIADIASLENKRQMLLMIGYGAAAVVAAFEWSDGSCYGNKKTAEDKKPEGEKQGEAQTAKSDSSTQPETKRPGPEKGDVKVVSTECGHYRCNYVYDPNASNGQGYGVYDGKVYKGLSFNNGAPIASGDVVGHIDYNTNQVVWADGTSGSINNIAVSTYGGEMPTSNVGYGTSRSGTGAKIK